MGRLWIWLKMTWLTRALWNYLNKYWLYPWTTEKPDSVRNELKKLQAASLDRLSTACVTFGILGAIGPSISVFLQMAPNSTPHDIPWLGLLFWTSMGISLHITAELLILDMRDKR